MDTLRWLHLSDVHFSDGESYEIKRMRDSIIDKMKEVFEKNKVDFVAEDLGLMAFTQVDYTFFIFGKNTRACVYRIADLIGYDMEEIEEKTSNGAQKKTVARLSFTKTEGMYEFLLPINGGKGFESLRKYFDTLFGIQKTLGNAMNNWNKQADAMKSVASGRAAVLPSDKSTRETTDSPGYVWPDGSAER